MSDTNLSPEELSDVKRNFVKAHGSVRWEDTRARESRGTSSRLADLDKKIKWHDRKIDFAFYMMIGVVIVVVLGFFQLLYSYYEMTQNAYLRFDETVKNYNEEKYKKLEYRMNSIELSVTPVTAVP